MSTLIDAPEEQQTELVKRHFPGILQRFDWKLPHEIDMADTGAIPELVACGKQAAAGMDWNAILD